MLYFVSESLHTGIGLAMNREKNLWHILFNLKVLPNDECRHQYNTERVDRVINVSTFWTTCRSLVESGVTSRWRLARRRDSSAPHYNTQTPDGIKLHKLVPWLRTTTLKQLQQRFLHFYAWQIKVKSYVDEK